MGEIREKGPTLSLKGELQGQMLLLATAAIHRLVSKKAYRDIVIDFGSVTRAYPDFMVPFICEIRRRTWSDKINLVIHEPDDPYVASFFERVNYTPLLRNRDEISHKAYGENIPAIPFASGDEQYEVVNLLVNWMLSVAQLGSRDDLQAFEWAAAEITDNVITHSEARLGGLAQASYFPSANSIQFVICDAGVGIATSLRQNPRFGKLTDRDALEWAVRESVTGKTSTNQGNGLYGTYELARASKGRFTLRSGHAVLYLDKTHKPVLRRSKIPFNGTLVICSLSLGETDLIQKALKIGGQPHSISYDYLDKIEDDGGGEIRIRLMEAGNGFASRRNALPLRTKVANILRTTDDRVVLDFAGVGVVSSSFADEFVAKLMREFGPMVFMSRISIRGANATVAGLLDRAMLLRMREGPEANEVDSEGASKPFS